MKKIPMRSCIVTHEKYEKKSLIRVVKNENELVIDKTGKLNGHGAYLKKDENVIKKAKQTKILEKLFEIEINDDFYNNLLEECK